MARAPQIPPQGGPRSGLPPIAGPDLACYIRDMLNSLRAWPLSQDQRVLARLLEAASAEAERAAREAVVSGL